MLIEHLMITALVVIVCFLTVFGGAVFVQFMDFDHVCDGLPFFDNLKLLVKCGKSTSIESFPKVCYCLHRGVFHDVRWVYLEVFLALLLAGIAVGHGLHLVLDGYNIFSPFLGNS